MVVPLNPAASSHLPSFITAPGQTDVLMVITAVILAVAVLLFGLVFFRLHSLPERMAHGSHRLQLEVVAVLCLLALLTHIHAFWVAALLLALIDIPDLGGWLSRIAGAVERIAGLKTGEAKTLVTPRGTTGDATLPGPVPAAAPASIGRPVKNREPTDA
jgi:hypothetical protein